MTKIEMELGAKAQACGMTLVHHPGKPYYVRNFEGTEYGPMTAHELRKWLAGYAIGMAAHAPDCKCSNLGCHYRNQVLSGEFVRGQIDAPQAV